MEPKSLDAPSIDVMGAQMSTNWEVLNETKIKTVTTVCCKQTKHKYHVWFFCCSREIYMNDQYKNQNIYNILFSTWHPNTVMLCLDEITWSAWKQCMLALEKNCRCTLDKTVWHKFWFLAVDILFSPWLPVLRKKYLANISTMVFSGFKTATSWLLVNYFHHSTTLLTTFTMCYLYDEGQNRTNDLLVSKGVCNFASEKYLQFLCQFNECKSFSDKQHFICKRLWLLNFR